MVMFKDWCSKKGYANANSLSHVLMDGGVLSIPYDRLDEFYEKCVECIKNNEKIFVVEQKTELYNFFVDIDYKDEEALNIEEIKTISKIICDKVKSLGGKNCIVSVAKPKNVGNLVKTGIHYNWNGLVVNQEGALTLRDHIISTLKLVYASQDWNDIVDVAVYGNPDKKSKGSGFRMPWSHKKGKHEECLGRGCSACHNTGKITQSPYLPVFKYSNNDIEIIDQEPSVEILKLTTVRTDCQTPTPIKELPKSKNKYIKEGGFTKTQTKNEVYDSETHALLETFIRKNMEGQHDTRITKLYKNKKSYLVSTTSKYCENLGREHNSNHIWFYINNEIIMQKCFCTCETNRGRKAGFCKDFSGKKHKLYEKIVDKLYTKDDDTPNKNKNINEKPVKLFDETKELIENFINKNMLGQKDVSITSLKKQNTKYIIETTSTFCEKAYQEHDDCIPFIIDNKGIIIQNCSCAQKKFTPRGHFLYSKIKDRLYPPKKK